MEKIKLRRTLKTQIFDELEDNLTYWFFQRLFKLKCNVNRTSGAIVYEMVMDEHQPDLYKTLVHVLQKCIRRAKLIRITRIRFMIREFPVDLFPVYFALRQGGLVRDVVWYILTLAYQTYTLDDIEQAAHSVVRECNYLNKYWLHDNHFSYPNTFPLGSQIIEREIKGSLL